MVAASDEGRLAEDVRKELDDLFKGGGGGGRKGGDQRLKGHAKAREAKELR